MSSRVGVKTPDIVRGEIRAYRKTKMTYEKIARLYVNPITGEPVGKGSVWNLEHGVEPTSYHIRIAFGLEPVILPEMYNEIRVCSTEGCDIPFVPNSPLRTKCFKCSPYKGVN